MSEPAPTDMTQSRKRALQLGALAAGWGLLAPPIALMLIGKLVVGAGYDAIVVMGSVMGTGFVIYGVLAIAAVAFAMRAKRQGAPYWLPLGLSLGLLMVVPVASAVFLTLLQLLADLL